MIGSTRSRSSTMLTGMKISITDRITVKAKLEHSRKIAVHAI